MNLFNFFSSLLLNNSIGYAVGIRVLELVTFREKMNKRETKVVNVLSYIHSTVWKYLFGKTADSLEKSTEVNMVMNNMMNVVITMIMNMLQLLETSKFFSIYSNCNFFSNALFYPISFFKHDDEYMIIDNNMLVNKFMSVPKSLGNHFTCAGKKKINREGSRTEIDCSSCQHWR